MNQPLRIWCGRAQLIGDTIMALNVAVYVKKLHPDCHLIWPIARKCSQAAPLYLNHPCIDQVYICDGQEGPESERDLALMNSCSIRFNVNPNHPQGDIWPNLRDIYLETFLMAGLSEEQYATLTEEERRPRLEKWFNVEKTPGMKTYWCKQLHRDPRTVALWPCAGYGRENKRNPSQEWYNELIKQLTLEGFTTYVFGHTNDFPLNCHGQYRDRSFFDQIKMTLGCDLMIGTDSGSALVVGAYGHPMISLLTNHWPNHRTNLTAFATNNVNNTSFFGLDNADAISHDEVMKRVKEIVL